MSRLLLSMKNMAANVVGWIIPTGMAFFATPFILHHLGPDAYGLGNLVLVVVGYFSLMDMGLDIAGVALLSEYRAKDDIESINSLLSTKLLFYGAVGFVGMTVLLLIAPLLPTHLFSVPPALQHDAVTVFRIGAVSLFVNMILMWTTVVQQGLQRYDVSNVITTTASVFGTVGSLAVVYAGYGVVGYVAARLVVSILSMGLGVVAAQRLIPGLRLRFGIDRLMIGRIWDLSVYAVVVKVVGMITGSVDRTLIGIWSGTAALAAYAVPTLVSNSISQLMSRMMHFIFPMASELMHSGQIEQLRSIFLRSSRFMVALSSMSILPMIVLADRFLILWIGPALAPASTPILRLLLASAYVGTMILLFNYVLSGGGFMKQFAGLYTARTLFLVLACVVFTRLWGASGAAGAILGAAIFDLGLGAFGLHRYLTISPVLFYSAYARPLGLAIALLVPVFAVRPFIATWPELLATLALFAVAFILLGFRIGVFDETERRALNQLKCIVLSRA